MIGFQLSKPQLNVNSITIQWKLGLTGKWLCIPPHHHHRNSMSAISQLLLTRFWRNFKHRFMGLSWTDFNYRSNICPGNICPGNICLYQEYLSCYWPDFDTTLKVGSWDYLEQISTIAEHLSRQHLSRQHLSWWHLSISAISQLLLARFWPNFNGRFLETFRTDSNC